MNELPLEKKRKQQILEAALTCFTKKGYFKTTMDEVVKESGLSKGALYWYYKSKKELFLALFDFYMHSYIDEVTKHISHDKTFEENLNEIGSVVFKMMESEKEHMNVFMEFMSFAVRDKDMQIKINNVYQEILNLIEKLLVENLKDKKINEEEVFKLSSVVAVIIDGLMIYQMFGLLKVQPDNIWNYFIRMISSFLSKGINDIFRERFRMWTFLFPVMHLNFPARFRDIHD